jgi:hypothetical protein
MLLALFTHKYQTEGLHSAGVGADATDKGMNATEFRMNQIRNRPLETSKPDGMITGATSLQLPD